MADTSGSRIQDESDQLHAHLDAQTVTASKAPNQLRKRAVSTGAEACSTQEGELGSASSTSSGSCRAAKFSADGTGVPGSLRRADSRQSVRQPEGQPAPLPLPSPRLVFSVPMGIMVFVSLSWTLKSLNQRDGIKGPEKVSPLSELLDVQALHHVGFAVANVSRSVSFYVGVLGGRAVNMDSVMAGSWHNFSGKNAGAAEADAEEPMTWQMVSFGTSQVLFWQQPPNSSTNQWASTLQREAPVHFAFRLAHRTDIGHFLDVIHERLQEDPELVATTAGCSEHKALQSGWRVVACRGPDAEAVQFWQPNLQVAQILEASRKEWAQVASDPRGRDLFE